MERIAGATPGIQKNIIITYMKQYCITNNLQMKYSSSENKKEKQINKQ